MAVVVYSCRHRHLQHPTCVVGQRLSAWRRTSSSLTSARHRHLPALIDHALPRHPHIPPATAMTTTLVPTTISRRRRQDASKLTSPLWPSDLLKMAERFGAASSNSTGNFIVSTLSRNTLPRVTFIRLKLYGNTKMSLKMSHIVTCRRSLGNHILYFYQALT